MKGIVPETILNRPDKMGLAVPVGKWFKKELKKWAEIRIQRFREREDAAFINEAWDAAGYRGEFDRRDYMRICLELWMDIMFSGDFEAWENLRLSIKDL